MYLQLAAVIFLIQLLRHQSLTSKINAFFKECVDISTLDRLEIETTLPRLLFMSMLGYSLIPIINVIMLMSLFTGAYNTIVGGAIVRASLSDKNWKTKPRSPE